MLVIFLDVAVYSILVPLFPSLFIETLGTEKGSFFWGIAQTCGGALGIINGFLSGLLSDRFGRKIPIVLNQVLALAALGLLGVALEKEQYNTFSAYLLLCGYVFRKGNRTIPVAMAYLVDAISSDEQLTALLTRVNSILGLAFGVGPLISSLLLSNLLASDKRMIVFGTSIVLINIAVACLQLHAAPKFSGNSKRVKLISYKSLKDSILKNKAIYIIHFAGCLGQQCYIATIGLVADDRFGIKKAKSIIVWSSRPHSRLRLQKSS